MENRENITTKHRLNRKYAILAAILVVVIVVPLAYFSYISNKAAISPRGTPIALYDHNFSALNPQVTEVSGLNGFFNNVSQGLPLQVNVTFTSKTDQPITIPIENLTVTYYNSTVNLHSIFSTNDNYSSIQQQAFNYSFSQKELALQPDLSNSTLLTIDLAQNAPTGQYTIEIRIGQVKTSNSIPYFATIELEMIVTPKTT